MGRFSCFIVIFLMLGAAAIIAVSAEDRTVGAAWGNLADSAAGGEFVLPSSGFIVVEMSDVFLDEEGEEAGFDVDFLRSAVGGKGETNLMHVGATRAARRGRRVGAGDRGRPPPGGDLAGSCRVDPGADGVHARAAGAGRGLPGGAGEVRARSGPGTTCRVVVGRPPSPRQARRREERPAVAPLWLGWRGDQGETFGERFRASPGSRSFVNRDSGSAWIAWRGCAILARGRARTCPLNRIASEQSGVS